MEKRFGALTFIPGDNAGNYPHCHSLYIDGQVKLLIDPASNRDRLSRLRDTQGVDVVFLSHWHEDHFMHLDMFDGKELWISEFDAEPLQSLEHFFDAYGMDAEERPPWTKTMYEQFHFKPRAANRLVKPAEVLNLGGIEVEIVHTPGHTPGHCSLYFRDQKILFLGDYDLTTFGPWYGDRRSDIDATIASVDRLRSIDAELWIASHGKGVFDNVPDDFWDAYVGVIHDRDRKLLELLNEPRTMSQIVDARIVYKKKRDPKEFFDFGERA
ncbi:MAG: MBL fold metallo-hydrolase, partial [Desulfomonile tiedjei]|nr:MBL fold metallo-hydrolase [Desulfomonile tiedjei]